MPSADISFNHWDRGRAASGLHCGGVGDGGRFEVADGGGQGNSMRIRFGQSNMADPLPAARQSQLLVTNFPWDGNAYPGALLPPARRACAPPAYRAPPAVVEASLIAHRAARFMHRACRITHRTVCAGNEFWVGMISASTDPCAACCSHIAELQNPDVNPRLCGANLREAQAGALRRCFGDDGAPLRPLIS